MWWVLSILALWLLFNWVSPFAALLSTQAKPISRGRLPAELLRWGKDKEVRFYVADLKRGYGFSVWAPPWSVVVFDKRFFTNAYPNMIRYVVAHELAHFSLGHHRERWLMVITGLVILPSVRKRLHEMEAEADAEAERVTGFKRSFFPQLQ